MEIPPLENGDRLSRQEFERRYAAMEYLKKAELIEGVVYMPSPVHIRNHAEPHSRIITWLGVFCAATPCVQLADNATVRLDADNEVQPDALLRRDTATEGHSRISEDDFVEGAPELIVEIAASSASYDLHDKLKAYRRNSVREYLVWLIHEKQIIWFQWRNGEYFILQPDEAGVIRSQIFPGLNLAADKMLAGDMTAVLAELQVGLEARSAAS
jgi:Uma2 family endonuclease